MRRHYWTLLLKGIMFGIIIIPILVSLNRARKHELPVKISQDHIERLDTRKYWHDGNHSVPDLSDKRCLLKKYLAELPAVSIVIPFHYEYLGTFARTLHSVVNRTPPELLKEIILVDDFSDVEFFATLEKYVSAHFDDKVQFLRMPEHVGLIQARLAGARKASAEVLVVLDAYIEVNHNWLPPLLEPIALNKHTITCPIIDFIDPNNFSYFSVGDKQGGFNWFLTYIETEIWPKDLIDNLKPYRNPVMMGAAFAISIEYFWELGGYDEGLEIWGGEQYDLSFKIWMCGGQLLNVPCSRVGQHFRGPLNKDINSDDTRYLDRNIKRVVDVWMDEYGKYVYEVMGEDLAKADAGDLTKQKALRERLHCKPFSWYMNEIAVNVLKEYPPEEPLEYASGAIQSVAAPQLCVDMMKYVLPGLYTCAKNLERPYNSQFFSLKWNHELRHHNTPSCFDVPEYYNNSKVIFYFCHNQGGTQFWYYDQWNKWLVHGPSGVYCLEASPSDGTLYMNICQKDNINMKWNFGRINSTALERFLKGIKH